MTLISARLVTLAAPRTSTLSMGQESAGSYARLATTRSLPGRAPTEHGEIGPSCRPQSEDGLEFIAPALRRPTNDVVLNRVRLSFIRRGSIGTNWWTDSGIASCRARGANGQKTAHSLEATALRGDCQYSCGIPQSPNALRRHVKTTSTKYGHLRCRLQRWSLLAPSRTTNDAIRLFPSQREIVDSQLTLR